MRTLMTFLACCVLTVICLAQERNYQHNLSEIGCGFHLLTNPSGKIPQLPQSLAKTCKHWDYGVIGPKLFVWSNKQQKLVFHSELEKGTENNPDVLFERIKDAESKDK